MLGISPRSRPVTSSHANGKALAAPGARVLGARVLEAAPVAVPEEQADGVGCERGRTDGEQPAAVAPVGEPHPEERERVTFAGADLARPPCYLGLFAGGGEILRQGQARAPTASRTLHSGSPA